MIRIFNRFNKIYSDGITLIEVLFSITVFSIGIIGIFRFQIAVKQGNICSKNLTTAVLLAETKIEDLKKIGFGNNTDSSDSIYSSGYTFIRSWGVTPAFQSSADMEHIKVTVTWTDALRDHAITLDGVLSKTMD